MFLGSRVRQVRMDDKVSPICETIVWTMWGSSTSHKPSGLHSLLLG
jgi:hypothetical protein